MLIIDQMQAWYGKTQALFDISFEVAAGEVVGVVGTNGAGKTTTVRGILGLVPTSGRVVIDGRVVTSWATHRRIRECGVAVVHESNSVFPLMTVRENLLVGQPRLARDNLELAFEPFPVLGERLNQTVGSLSGGQRQMVALARAVINRPRVLLLDEPSLGLAPLVVDEIYSSLRKMLGRDMSVVVVEQSIARVRTLSDRLVLISSGRSSEEVVSSDDDGVARLEHLAFGEDRAYGLEGLSRDA